jgi:hypothetical protein
VVRKENVLIIWNERGSIKENYNHYTIKGIFPQWKISKQLGTEGVFTVENHE